MMRALPQAVGAFAVSGSTQIMSRDTMDITMLTLTVTWFSLPPDSRSQSPEPSNCSTSAVMTSLGAVLEM